MNKNIEIERKFLVNDESYKGLASSVHKIAQGYLSDSKNATVRIRILDDKAFLTVKGLTTGITRKEYEYQIPIEDAEEMLKMCGGKIIEKYRYIVKKDGMIWEIDEFKGMLEGLVIAEIELQSEGSEYTKPSFIGLEVSGDPVYYNSNLINLKYEDLINYKGIKNNI